MPDHISLSELQQKIKNGIDNAHPLPYWVTAEISELKVNYSGHCYIELVEKGGENQVPQAKVSAVIWRNSYQIISSYFMTAAGQPLASGIKVLIKVSVTYNMIYGLSLQITDIDPSYTLGDIARQRRETIQRLQDDGIFEMNREIEIERVVQRIAVISSRNAAGYQDFINELSDSPYRFEVVLYDAFMQGAEAEESIVAALEEVAEVVDNYDVVVLIRGGGSQSDLGCFNSYRLCSHLVQFPLPILTGIGHDKDQSVADLIASVSLKTPTAVAVWIKERVAQFEFELKDIFEELSDFATRRILDERQRLQTAAYRLQRISADVIHPMDMLLERFGAALKRAVGESLQQNKMLLDRSLGQLEQGVSYFTGSNLKSLSSLKEQLRNSATNFITSQNREIVLRSELIEASSLSRIMNMGFAYVSSNGRVIKAGDKIKVGDQIEVTMRDKTIEANINKIR